MTAPLAARRLPSWSLLMLVGALSACASGNDAGGDLKGSKQELKTASDASYDEKRAAIRLQLAIGYYQQGSLDVALDEIKKAVTANPELADAYGVRALIYTAMGEMVLAEENFQRAMRLAPRNPELNNNYGSFLCQNGRHALGIAQFEIALKNPMYQSPLKALANAGACSLEIKDLDRAERYLTEALRYDPDLLSTSAGLARVYFERRDYPRAGFFISRVKEAASLDTLSADVLWLGMRVERKLGNEASAAAMATQLRRRHPGSVEYAAFRRGAFDE